MPRIPAPRANVRADYAPAGKHLRRALFRKAAAMKRAQAARVLCEPTIKPSFDEVAQARVWAAICRKLALSGGHIRLAEDCQ